MKKAACEVCCKIVNVRDSFDDKRSRVYCCKDHKTILELFDLNFGFQSQEPRRKRDAPTP